MASIRKRSWSNASGAHTAFILDYTDRAGTRHIKTFARRRDADAARTQVTGELAAGTHTPRHRSATVAVACAAWITQAEADGLERSTIRQYRQHVAHILPLLGTTKLADLTVADVTAFRNELFRAGHSRQMTKKIVSSFGAILQHAQTIRLVAQNVVRVEIAENKTATRRRRLVEKRQERPIEAGVDYPTKDEIRAMLAVTSVVDRRGRRPNRSDPPDLPRREVLWWRALIATAILSGLRASELRALKWANVNFAENQIEVRQRADRFNQIGPLKSSAARREVPIGPWLATILREWRLAMPLKMRGADDLVFPNSIGRIATLPSIHMRILLPLQREAGIAPPEGQKGPKYGLHALRHAAASLWIDAGENVKKVQYLLGHSTVQLTLDVYSHLWPEEDRASAANLEKKLFKR